MPRPRKFRKRAGEACLAPTYCERAKLRVTAVGQETHRAGSSLSG